MSGERERYKREKKDFRVKSLYGKFPTVSTLMLHSGGFCRAFSTLHKGFSVSCFSPRTLQ